MNITALKIILCWSSKELPEDNYAHEPSKLLPYQFLILGWRMMTYDENETDKGKTSCRLRTGSQRRPLPCEEANKRCKAMYIPSAWEESTLVLNHWMSLVVLLIMDLFKKAYWACFSLGFGLWTKFFPSLLELQSFSKTVFPLATDYQMKFLRNG